MSNEKKEGKIINPIRITEDIWFYVNPKSFDFIVWVKVGDRRNVAQFRLTHKRLQKYMGKKSK